jgi:hypothetical protein
MTTQADTKAIENRFTFTNILDEQIAARERAEAWQDEQELLGNEFPYLELDRQCTTCKYICKTGWRFAGLAGASRPNDPFTVGPECPVLWKFSPFNPLRK